MLKNIIIDENQLTKNNPQNDSADCIYTEHCLWGSNRVKTWVIDVWMEKVIFIP